jgi:YD repeat-containing protein
VLDIEYTYSNSNPTIHDNNGNVRTQKITAGAFAVNQTYAYEELNRLSSASEKVGSETNPRWTQSYGYDRFGNRTSLTNTGEIPPQTAPGVDPTTNRLVGFPYDAAGNLTQYNSQDCDYDGENRMVLRLVSGRVF